MECDLRFEGEMNSLDMVNDYTSGIQLYQQFERLEYEALAERKRKALAAADSGERSGKKPRCTLQEIYGIIEAMMEDMNYGTALVNLALGLRLQNKQQCVTQGLAFLYNNLRLCENSQEALYNVARACHHIGLVSLAASHYEKVLAVRQKDCSLPKLVKADKDPRKQPEPGYCDLHREAAYTLHLIYKNSGSVNLAGQILRDYCTL